MKKFAIRGSRKCYFLIFTFFIFPYFKWLLSKIFWKNQPFLKGVRRFSWSSTSSLISFIHKFLTTKARPFWNLHEDAFCLFNLFLMKEILQPHFWCYIYFKLHKLAAFKLRAVEYVISLFLLIHVYFNEAFVKNFMKTFFNTNLQNSFQDYRNYVELCDTKTMALWI